MKFPKIAILYELSVYFENIPHENRSGTLWFLRPHNTTTA